MMFQATFKARSSRVLASTSMLVAALTAHTALAQQDSGVEQIVVTGSRLPSTSELATAAPVVVLDREDIDVTGAASIGEVLRNMPFATSSQSDLAGRGGGGDANIALRGLDAVNTLVLIDGRRMISNSETGAVDLNGIPFEVIERIDVLKDGASPIYGADAIAGVVNIITMRDFEGIKIQAEYGQSSREDARTHEINATFGNVFDGGNFIFNVSHKSADGFMLADRPISADADRRIHFGGGNLRTPIPEVALVRGLDPNDPDRQLILDDGVQQATGLDDFRDFRFTTTLPAPPDAAEEDAVNFFAFDRAAADLELTNLWFNGNLELADLAGVDAEAFVQASVTRRKSEGFTGSPNFGSVFGDPVILSANNDFNPFGIDLDVSRKLVEADFRRNNVDQQRNAITLGVRGDIGDSWDWDLSYSYQIIDQFTDGGKGVVRGRLRDAAGDSDVCRALNNGCVPINLLGAQGTITREMIDFISADDFSKVDARMDDYLFNVSGAPFSLPAGDVAVAAGLEYRQEYYRRDSDRFSNDNAFINQTLNADANPPRRDVKEVYAEVALPLLADKPMVNSLDLNFAVRYSDFNTFGDTTNTKIGLTWAPVEQLMLRGTATTGFRIPNFNESFGGQSRGFESIVDPCVGDDFASLPGCGGRRAEVLATTGAFVVSGGNPELTPEDTKNFTFGIVWTPPYAPGLSVTADAWRIEKRDVIARNNANFILDRNARFGEFPGLVIRDEDTNAVTEVIALLNNLGELNAQGIDASVEYRTADLPVGDFTARVDLTYLDSFELSPGPGQEPTERVDTYSNTLGTLARLRTNGTLQWNFGNLSATYGYRYVGGVDNVGATAAFPGRIQPVDSYLEHDVVASYLFEGLRGGDWNTKLTIGIENVSDEDPPFIDGNFSGGFDTGTFNSRGRFYFARVDVSM